MATRQEQHALWDAVDTIHRYYEELFRPVASAFSLTAGQLKVLHTLHRFGALTVGELAGAVGMARTNMSSLCKKLCKQGFLVRSSQHGTANILQPYIAITTGPIGNCFNMLCK